MIPVRKKKKSECFLVTKQRKLIIWTFHILHCVTVPLAEVIPSLQGASPGSIVMLTCRANNVVGSVEFVWSRADGVEFMENNRFEVTGDVGDMLRITSAEVSDSGVYICTIRTSDGDLTGQGDLLIGSKFTLDFVCFVLIPICLSTRLFRLFINFWTLCVVKGMFGTQSDQDKVQSRIRVEASILL